MTERRCPVAATPHRRWPFPLLVAAAGLVLLVAPELCSPIPRLVWNASASAPIGLYRVTPGARIAVGDMVIARLAPSMRSLAARRHYLPANVPLVKRVVATRGAMICARGATIALNGRPVAERHRRDAAGRAMPWWRGCRKLTGDAVFLLMAGVPQSFDGRYFGPTDGGNIVGRAQLIWAR